MLNLLHGVSVDGSAFEGVAIKQLRHGTAISWDIIRHFTLLW
jgi:hypothetical protein